jgi:uncharacterized membrane protein
MTGRMTIDDFTLARVIHVASVVGWIGGVWFVTFVVMPAIRRSDLPADRLAAFHRIEQGFALQARIWVLLAGLSGFWMAWRGDLWARFVDPAYWWMGAMLALWTIFAAMLFLIEPLFLHRRMAASPNPDADFRKMTAGHWLLSVAALVTLLGAMAGAHGLI